MSCDVPADARYEVKFACSELMRSQVWQWIRCHPAGFRTAFPVRQINNVYFDTHDYDAFSENLAGGSVRTKLRYRWYGDSLWPERGTLELKCKRNLYGWKRLYPILESPPIANTDWRAFREGLEKDLSPDGRAWLRGNPQTVLVNSYQRAYALSADGRIRATVDWDQHVWDQRLSRHPNLTRLANLPRAIVLEIKCAREHREDASRVIQTIPIRVSRFSKYVSGVLAISGP